MSRAIDGPALTREASMQSDSPPISLTPIGRRRFLGNTLAVAATASAARLLGRGSSLAQGGTLVVTSYGGPWEQFMRDTIVPAYEKEHPGTTVELAIGLSKDWVAKMKAAGKANSPYDIVICNEVYA